MNIRKNILIILTFVLLISITVGSGFSIVNAKDKELTIWSNVPKDYTQCIIEKYESQNPNIKIKYLFIPWNNAQWAQKLSTAKLSDSLPDVVMSPQVGAEWSDPVRGVFMSLNKYIKRDNIDVNDFVAPLMKVNEIDNKIYALPVGFDYGMMYYNKKMFKEAGLNGPPKTWEELIEYTEKLTIIENGKLKRMGFAMLEFPVFFSLHAAGGGHMFSKDGTDVTFNTPEMRKTAELMMELRDIMGGMEQMTKFASGETSGAAADTFVRGKSAMIYLHSAGELGRIKKYAPDMEFGMAPLPTHKGLPQQLVQTDCRNLLITSGSKHPDIAWDFVKFATSRENMKYFLVDTFEEWPTLPGRISVAQDPQYTSLHPKLPKIGKLVDDLRPLGHVVHPLATDAHWINMIKAIDKILWNKKKPEEALAKAEEEAQEILDEALEKLEKNNIEMNYSWD